MSFLRVSTSGAFANGIDCFLNSINRIYKLLYIKVGIH